MAHHLGMVTSPRFKFTATLLVSVLAVVLTLLMPDESDPADSPVHSASLLPPPQR